MGKKKFAFSVRFPFSALLPLRRHWYWGMQASGHLMMDNARQQQQLLRSFGFVPVAGSWHTPGASHEKKRNRSVQHTSIGTSIPKNRSGQHLRRTHDPGLHVSKDKA
jgi:hypothetical protein